MEACLESFCKSQVSFFLAFTSCKDFPCDIGPPLVFCCKCCSWDVIHLEPIILAHHKDRPGSALHQHLIIIYIEKTFALLFYFSFICRLPCWVRPVQTSEPACHVSVRSLHPVSCAKIWTNRPGEDLQGHHVFISGGRRWRFYNDKGRDSEA